MNQKKSQIILSKGKHPSQEWPCSYILYFGDKAGVGGVFSSENEKSDADARLPPKYFSVTPFRENCNIADGFHVERLPLKDARVSLSPMNN